MLFVIDSTNLKFRFRVVTSPTLQHARLAVPVINLLSLLYTETVTIAVVNTKHFVFCLVSRRTALRPKLLPPNHSVTKMNSFVITNKIRPVARASSHSHRITTRRATYINTCDMLAPVLAVHGRFSVLFVYRAGVIVVAIEVGAVEIDIVDA
ncbi:hypothetical protein BGY98DRAFT_967844 [Russula aff. rugulosa BPL654]|nr:hypothetical protein BGY98DRAFT_967844 [Russula aff. rugulosa BPL654]